MDISTIGKLDGDRPSPVHLKKGTELEYFGTEKRAVLVHVFSTYSQAFRDASKIAREKGEAADRKGEKLTDAELEAIKYDTEAACIASWVFTAGGKPLPVTGENWKAISTERSDWRLQILGAMNDDERFFVASSAR